jgi:hypothetical protein
MTAWLSRRTPESARFFSGLRRPPAISMAENVGPPAILPGAPLTIDDVEGFDDHNRRLYYPPGPASPGSPRSTSPSCAAWRGWTRLAPVRRALGGASREGPHDGGQSVATRAGYRLAPSHHLPFSPPAVHDPALERLPRKRRSSSVCGRGFIAYESARLDFHQPGVVGSSLPISLRQEGWSPRPEKPIKASIRLWSGIPMGYRNWAGSLIVYLNSY